MNRINHSAKWVAVSAFVFMAAAFASGAVLFEDDFASAAASHDKWLASDGVTAAVSGGSCALGIAGQSIGNYTHPFAAPGPSTFTLSYTLKSQTGTANRSGALFCKQPNTYNGYFITVEEDMLVVYKMVQTASADGTSVGWNPLYFKESIDINPSNNKVTVSKSGSRIVLFANDEYVGEFTDASYSSGDLALFVASGASAVFGPVRMTDEFTEGGTRTTFSDNFTNGRSKYWNFVQDGGNPDTGSANGMLTVKTGAGVTSWAYVNMKLTDFTARVDVRHVSGGTTANHIYGIVLVGVPPQGGAISIAYFAIAGGRTYWIGGNGMPSSSGQSLDIRGSAGGSGAALYTDTLEVSKKSESSSYELSVNGHKIADYPVANVNFEVTGIGIFSYPDLEIQFDNFEAKPDGAASVKFGQNRPTVRRGAAAKSASNVFYDLRGRKRYTVNPQAPGNMPLRAAGMYINENGREVLVRKNRR